jgi:hypothetical protein
LACHCWAACWAWTASSRCWANSSCNATSCRPSRHQRRTASAGAVAWCGLGLAWASSSAGLARGGCGAVAFAGGVPVVCGSSSAAAAKGCWVWRSLEDQATFGGMASGDRARCGAPSLSSGGSAKRTTAVFPQALPMMMPTATRPLHPAQTTSERER